MLRPRHPRFQVEVLFKMKCGGCRSLGKCGGVAGFQGFGVTLFYNKLEHRIPHVFRSQSTSERRRNNFKGVMDVNLEAQAGIWP